MIAAGAFIFADIADFLGKGNLIGGTEAVFADGVIVYQVFKDVPDGHMGYRLSICFLVIPFDSGIIISKRRKQNKCIIVLPLKTDMAFWRKFLAYGSK